MPEMETRTREVESILEKALRGNRITPEEALLLYNNGGYHQIAYVASELRNRKISSDQASYTLFRIVNYTDYCSIQCSFCSFKAKPDGDFYVLTPDQVLDKMSEAHQLGATQLFFQGGVHPGLPLDYYLEILQRVKERFGSTLHIRAFSPVELLHLAKNSGLALDDLLQRLKKAGLDSVPGAGAEILTERMRQILSPAKTSVSQWVEIMESCHRAHLPGSANIVFGSSETREEVIEHLSLVRDIQDRTGGFHSFVPWTFQQQTKDFYVRKVPPHEYLKVLGICRIFLDNIDHVEVSVMVVGAVLGALALHSGADDISSIVLEENVLRNNSFTSEEGARNFLIENGFTPRRRDFDYRYQPV